MNGVPFSQNNSQTQKKSKFQPRDEQRFAVYKKTPRSLNLRRSKKARNAIAAGFLMMIMVIGVFSAQFLSEQSQDVRQQASSYSCGQVKIEVSEITVEVEQVDPKISTSPTLILTKEPTASPTPTKNPTATPTKGPDEPTVTPVITVEPKVTDAPGPEPTKADDGKVEPVLGTVSVSGYEVRVISDRAHSNISLRIVANDGSIYNYEAVSPVPAGDYVNWVWQFTEERVPGYIYLGDNGVSMNQIHNIAFVVLDDAEQEVICGTMGDRSTCGQSCLVDIDCVDNLSCISVDEGNKHCLNPECPDDIRCTCDEVGVTPKQTITPEPTLTPQPTDQPITGDPDTDPCGELIQVDCDNRDDCLWIINQCYEVGTGGRVSPTATVAPSPTSSAEVTPSVSPTIAQSAEGDTLIDMQLRLAGVPGIEPDINGQVQNVFPPNLNGQTVPVHLSLQSQAGVEIYNQILDFNYVEPAQAELGYYELSQPIIISNLVNDSYKMFVKGPRHRRMEFCESPQPENKECSPFEAFYLEAGTNYTFDFRDSPLEAGDLKAPETGGVQDGVVNRVDYGFIFGCQASRGSETCLNIGDLDYSGVVDNVDLGLIVKTLSTASDD